MKRLLLISICLILWALSTSVKAVGSEVEHGERGFSHRMQGTATLANGESIDINMLIGFQQSQTRGWYFRVGPEYVFRDNPPSSYYLNMIMDGNGQAYVLEFSQQPLKHFKVTFEGREIELMQASGSDIAFGMRLRIDDRQFLFDSSHPRLRIEFSEQGLSNIVAERTLRDLSIRRAQ